MPTRLLPLEPIVTVPVIVENEETPLQLCALEVARCEFGLMTNIQAVCDQPVHAQIIRFGLPVDREAFQYRLLLGLREQAQPLKPSEADIDRALLQLQTQVEQALRQQAAQPTEPAIERPREATITEQLVHLACDSAQLFLTPHAEPFAHVQIETEGEKGRKGEGEPSEQSKIENRKSKIAQTLPLRSPEFRDWLIQRFWRAQGKAPHSHALQTALDLLAGLARYEGGSPRELRHRTAWYEQALWLHLGDPAWQAIHITSEGWQILPDPPPLFRRSPTTTSLPLPESDGNLAELRACLHLPDDHAWTLLLAWLVAGFLPHISHPLLCIAGPHSAGKSTLARILLDLLDPTATPLHTQPSNAAEWAQMVRSGWARCLDNIDRLPPWLAEAISRSLTGEGDAVAPGLHSTHASTLPSRNVVILTCGEDTALTPHLSKRTLWLRLPPIDADHRRLNQQLQQQWQQARPRVFAALLDLLAAVLKELPNVSLRRTPTLADFAAIGVATERALDWPNGTFAKAFEHNLREQSALPPADRSLIQLLHAFLQPQPVWEGTAQQLLQQLQEFDADRTWDNPALPRIDLPTQPNHFTESLRRLEPDLRSHGCRLTFTRNKRERLIRCEFKANAE